MRAASPSAPRARNPLPDLFSKTRSNGGRTIRCRRPPRFGKACLIGNRRVKVLAQSTFMDTSVDEKLRFILERRSIRVYAPGEVSEEHVQRLLAAAMAAPSAAARHPWRFVVMRQRQTLLRIAAALPYGQMLASAALGIAVCGDLEAAHDRQLSYLLQDCSAAIENLLLCAHVLGLGTCWLGVHPRENRIKSMKEILSLPASILPVACISVGYPGESKEPRATYDPDLVHFEAW